MPANQRQQTAKSKAPAQVPTSPTSKATAKYTNKDGSKFITVPKPLETTPTAMAQTTTKPNGQTPTDVNGSAPAVNRKKQKRREKQAAKLAAEGITPNQAQTAKQIQELEARFREHGLDEPYEENSQFDPADGDQGIEYYSDEEGGYSGSYGRDSPPNGYTQPAGKKSKKKKNNKAKKTQLPDTPNNAQQRTNGTLQPHIHNHAPLSLPPLGTNMPRGTFCVMFKDGMYNNIS